MADEVLRVVIVGDDRSLTQAFRRGSRNASQFRVQMTRTRDVVRGVFAAGGITAGLAGFTAAIAGSVKAASSLEEQMNKVNVVFGDSAGDVQKWSQSVTAAFGLSRRQALETAGSFGLILKGAGLTEKNAAGLSKTLTELGADLASFADISLEDALQKLRSGLSGEAEPLRVLGVDLTEAAVKQRAYREGIAETGAELTQQQKVLARYAQIMAQTTDAQGDAERTAGSYANVMRRLGGVLENLQASLGQALLPALTKVADSLSKFLADSENQVRVQKAVQDAVKLVSDAFRVLYDIFQTITPVAREIVDTLGGLKNTLKLLAAAFVAVRITSFVTGLQATATAASTTTARVTALRVALQRLALIGLIAIPIEIILNREAIDDKVQEFLRGHGLGFLATKKIEIPANISVEELKRQRDQVAALTGENGLLVEALDKVIDRMSKVKSKKVKLEIETAVTTPGGTGRRDREGARTAFADSVIGAVDDVLAGSRKAIADATKKVKTGLRTEELEKAFEEKRDAFAKLIANLQLGVDRAELTAGLKNDVAALNDLKAGLERQIRAGVDVSSAQSQLVGVVAEIADKQQEIAAAAQTIVQARQFRALGLSTTGDEIIPGIKNLKTRIDNALRLISTGQVEVGSKIASRLKLARNAITREGKELTDETRSWINDFLKSFEGLEKGTKGPLTKASQANISALTKGLTLPFEDLKTLQSRLSRLNTAGLQLAGPSGRSGAFGVPISAANAPIVIENRIILDGKEIAASTTRQQQKSSRRGTASTRGTFAGRRSGV